MTDLYFFILTAINLFVLLFMCVLIRLSETLNPRQARGFLVTYILIGSISILELISVLVNDGPLWLRWLNILSNLAALAEHPFQLPGLWSDSCSADLSRVYPELRGRQDRDA